MYIAIDIGGTNIRISATKTIADTKLLETKFLPTENNFNKYIQNIIKNIYSFTEKPHAIGIGIAGSVSENILTGSIALTLWVDQPIVETLQKDFNCPIFVENDGVVAALGETTYGVNHPQQFLYITWGTGVGGATVYSKNNKVTVSKADRTKNLSHFEEIAGGKILEKRFLKQPKMMDDTEWMEVFQDLHSLLKRVSEEFNLETIVLGGGIVEKQKERLNKFLLQNKIQNVHLSQLGDQTGLYGAFALIKDNLK